MPKPMKVPPVAAHWVKVPSEHTSVVPLQHAPGTMHGSGVHVVPRPRKMPGEPTVQVITELSVRHAIPGMQQAPVHGLGLQTVPAPRKTSPLATSAHPCASLRKQEIERVLQ